VSNDSTRLTTSDDSYEERDQMTHDQYQEQISRLIDHDLREEDSSQLFTHMASCRECREFLNSSLRLRSGLAANSLATPSNLDRTMQQRFISPVAPKPRNSQSLWRRQVTMRFPVVAFLLCLIAAGAVLAFSGRSPFSEPETVYVTRLPAVVITDGTESVQPKN
jgi:anti-sigma factor RsiW